MKVRRLTALLGVAMWISSSLNGTAQISRETATPPLETALTRVAVSDSALATDHSKTVPFGSNREPGPASPSVAAPVPSEHLAAEVVAVHSSSPNIDRPDAREVHIWEALLVAQHSAAVFDAWSTRQAMTSGNGYERNPLMRPFAASVAIYPMLQIAPLGVDFITRRFMNSNHALLRKTWWLPQTVSVSASLWCGARNIHVAELRR